MRFSATRSDDKWRTVMERFSIRQSSLDIYKDDFRLNPESPIESSITALNCCKTTRYTHISQLTPDSDQDYASFP